jgi:predicted RND superfamily exporter protein
MAGSHHIERPDSKIAQKLEKLIFGHRLVIVIVFALLTAVLATIAVRGLHIDASFTKQLPLEH